MKIRATVIKDIWPEMLFFTFFSFSEWPWIFRALRNYKSTDLVDLQSLCSSIGLQVQTSRLAINY